PQRVAPKLFSGTMTLRTLAGPRCVVLHPEIFAIPPAGLKMGFTGRLRTVGVNVGGEQCAGEGGWQVWRISPVVGSRC
ncbi:MAG: hypothetical protein NTU53_03580, partial [Planctomycetota bacterium]|nr:hypothetical protein [Planctomycetota bacterium]